MPACMGVDNFMLCMDIHLSGNATQSAMSPGGENHVADVLGQTSPWQFLIFFHLSCIHPHASHRATSARESRINQSVPTGAAFVSYSLRRLIAEQEERP